MTTRAPAIGVSDIVGDWSLFPRVRQAVLDLAEREAGSGGSVGIVADGHEPFLLAWGHSSASRRYSRHTPFPLMCASKPFLGLALLQGLDAAGIGAETDIRFWYPEIPFSATVAELLLHTGGLMSSFRMHLPFRSWPSGCECLLHDLRRMKDWDTDTRARYSNVDAWCILALIVEHVSGRRYWDAVDDLLHRTLSVPMVVYSPAEVGARRDTLASPEARSSSAAWLALPEHDLSALVEGINPSAGGTATALGLSQLYATIARVSCSQSGLGRILRVATSPLRTCVDEYLRVSHAVSHGYGFQVGMSDYGAGLGWGTSSFGHSGAIFGGRSVIAWGDSASRAGFCIHLRRSWNLGDNRFRRIGTAIRKDLDAVGLPPRS